MHRGLVALSASAVAAIYMAGYLRTQAADASIAAAAVPTETAVQAAATGSDQAAPTVTVAPQAPPTTTPASNPFVQRQIPVAPRLAPTPQTAAPASSGSASQATQYRDGTFSGQGTSRRGDVWVNVQIQGGRISNVTITRSTLQYPLRDIANLPSEVVQRQTANVDVVSRATYSSMAFRGAVSQALASAKAG
jgi:uncharacterized protein with FMN-binding domain